jgi:adenosylcobinamide amidohydrolase
MLVTTLCTGDAVHRYKKSLVVFFNGKRRVLGTGPHNGGYRENLSAMFNNDCTTGAGMAAALRAPTYAEHLALLCGELGLDPQTSTGISTAAQMENVSIKQESYRALTVTALVTGGVEVNGGRAGDPSSWDEFEALEAPLKQGTINILLHINVDLTQGALARALVTCTEAKTAALQELLAPSRYSQGLATGSGTDGTIIAANADSELRLENAGKHSKLGELIGRTVKAAVKEALYRQTGLSPESQMQVLKRVDRFGISEDALWERCAATAGINRAAFSMRCEEVFRDPLLVTHVSLYVHLLDQLAWGLIREAEARSAAAGLFSLMGIAFDPAADLTEGLAAGLLHY